ncbi:MAG: Rrf2 family transcriptional regulator [Flavobacteriales bacterium]|nr:MAG: Rrf2 family transcriptional regulator [Flavobacteriales bacterium]
MFSKACMYAIRATVLLASDEAKGVRWTLSAIVEETGAPEAFMAKILRKLVRAGILRSVKGPGGGFDMLPGRAGILRLGEVVTAIDEDHLFKGCALGFSRCDAKKPCPIHTQVEAVRERLRGVLAITPIKDLGRDLHDGRAFLKGKL